jgi:chromosome segregation ATPase
MSADERILRLENALATLAELSAHQEQRITRLEEISGRLEEGFRALAQVSVDQQRRVARLEESYVALVEMLGRHDDRLDADAARQDELRAAQAETERRAAESERKIAELAEAQAHSDRRMDALIDIVQNWHKNGESKS